MLQIFHDKRYLKWAYLGILLMIMMAGRAYWILDATMVYIWMAVLPITLVGIGTTLILWFAHERNRFKYAVYIGLGNAFLLWAIIILFNKLEKYYVYH